MVQVSRDSNFGKRSNDVCSKESRTLTLELQVNSRVDHKQLPAPDPERRLALDGYTARKH